MAYYIFGFTMGGLSCFKRLLACIYIACFFSGAAMAADSCSGWGGEVMKQIDLGLPPTIDLTINNSVTGTVLDSGTVKIPPLNCVNDAGINYTLTAINWMTGSSAFPDIRAIAPGLGLRLKYTSIGGKVGILPSINAGTHSLPTDGLNWTAMSWELIRLAGSLTPGSLSLSNIVTITLGANSDGSGTWPSLTFKNSSSVIVSASCVLSVDNSLIILPDTSTLTLRKKDVSESVSLAAAITCPENTIINDGTTLTMNTPAADITDVTLVGNTGTASGVGIEVLDGNGERVNASGGKVYQKVFALDGNSTSTAVQNFSVRMRHLPGSKIAPGTVRGTFTLTLSVN